ncbi:DNase family Scn1 [Pyrenophora seminiperda CCB06]|uniref:DNase family Scn1 n=1 Tax=Pyrenophora seminiperda CCB06 TaxID=1302712 RepID=A0A3M7MBL9_9PLEO|nr:DNase family Scn1 [Pyrenophora seminiperda CCB06]
MATENKEEAFPWHLGVYDAHCHPTDTMSSIETIQDMKARVLTVMATRAEDQDLVMSVADKHGIKSFDPAQWSKEECIVPCFGWHPWFSYQMYLTEEQDDDTKSPNQEPLTGEAKIKHYQSVLQPSRQPPSEQDRAVLLSLPDPTPFTAFLSLLRQNLKKYPYAMVGEIGLDRAFRVPEAWAAGNNADLWAKRNDSLTLGGREGRRLTPFRCTLAHQKRIFKMQLQLAAEMGRAVSVHGVQAHGSVLEVLSELWKGHEEEVLSKRERKKRGVDHLKAGVELVEEGKDEETKQTTTTTPTPKPYPPRICLHSYSGSPSIFAQYCNPAIPAQIFISFSTAINLSDTPTDSSTPQNFIDMINTVPDHMLLVESDLHTAGQEMDKRLADIVTRICKIKEWSLEKGVEILGRNWRRFAFGGGGD